MAVAEYCLALHLLKQVTCAGFMILTGLTKPHLMYFLNALLVGTSDNYQLVSLIRLY